MVVCAGSLTIVTFDLELYSARRAGNSSMKLKACVRVYDGRMLWMLVLCVDSHL